MAHDVTKMKVRVLFFGAARDAVGQEQIEVEFESPINADGARAKLLSAYPSLQRFGKSLLFAVNQQYAQSDREISEGDELAVFPPVSGGSAGSASQEHAAKMPVLPDFFELTTDSIDVGAIARRVVLPQCGATVT